MPSSSRWPTLPERPEVWLTEAAVEDLHRLDGAPLVWALKKMLLLETDPHAGQPLLGTLIGYRKLTVGNRDWRLIWRVTTDERGTTIVDIAEVWAVGARSHAAVYAEMTARVATLPDNPTRRSLHSVITELGRRARHVRARPPVEPPPRVEPWLAHRLIHTAGIDPQVVALMTSEEAVDAWTAYMLRDRPS